MSTAQAVALGIALAAVLVGLMVTSSRLVGQIAERFGEDPRPWRLRMLPFTVLGPLITWLLLSRRGGGGFA
jgi:hypothetical protein